MQQADQIKLLVIDDEEANVRVLAITLKSDGYKVFTAFGGEEGLDVFLKDKPDIVLTDIKMPGMDGIEVLKKIKAMNPEVEVIIITGHGDIDNAIEALQHGASDFINKPIRDEALSIALMRAQEKLDIKRKLKNYTINLEKEIQIATREIRRQSNFLTKLIVSSYDGIVATDKNFRVVIFNPGAESIFGYSPSKVINQMTTMDLYPPEIVADFKEKKLSLAQKINQSWKDTAIIAKSGQKIPVRYSGTLLYEKDKVMGSVAFFQDLREIKRLEKELIQSERMAAIGQTVAGLAHEIKNILHGFKGGSYIVNIGIDKGDHTKLKGGWEMIQKNIGRTSDLVMDLLSYSKERKPEYESCYPNDIIEDVIELLQETAKGNHIVIDKVLDESIGNVLMDPRSIHRSMLNIVTNAIDACIFDEAPHKKRRVHISSRRETGNMIRLQVSDNGIGMDDKVQEQLFKSFFSTKGHKGTGLGLLITKKLIEEHHGTIDVHSEPGEGTTFTVQLPFRPTSIDEQNGKLKQ
jgi:PAS domain S-box-containing protein